MVCSDLLSSHWCHEEKIIEVSDATWERSLVERAGWPGLRWWWCGWREN